MSTTNIFLILFCVLTEAARELCFKRAADGKSLLVALRNPLIWAGIFFWAIELVAWVRVLEFVPLTVAFPLMALIYVLTFFGGVILLKEPLTKRHGIGALLVTAGVACIGSTGL